MLLSTTTERSDPLCLPEVTAAALLFDAPWWRFGVIGDSLSAGTGDPTPGYADRGWAERVANVLRLARPDLRYLNTAEIGATTARTIDRQLRDMTGFGPDLLHLPSGANDITRRDPDFGEIEKTMRRLYELAARTRAQLTAFTLGRAYVVPRFPDWPERVRTMNALTLRLGAEYDAVVIDMWNHPVNDRHDLLSADRIHFSTSGQAVLATEVVRHLAHVLAGRTPV